VTLVPKSSCIQGFSPEAVNTAAPVLHQTATWNTEKHRDGETERKERRTEIQAESKAAQQGRTYMQTEKRKEKLRKGAHRYRDRSYAIERVRDR
jgi:hypothetical protein